MSAEAPFTTTDGVEEMPHNSVLVTRSDLPPAPPAQLSEATSPYARLTHAAQAAVELNAEAPREDRTEVL